MDPRRDSPTLKKLLPRLAPERLRQLLDIAVRRERPEKPAPGACCGSSCDPCVLTLYAQELRIWKECEAVRSRAEEEENVLECEAATNQPPPQIDQENKVDPAPIMTGAFDW